MREALMLEKSGWCRGAVRRASANCDARPSGVSAELLVVHSISLPPGRYGGPEIIDFFTNRLAWDAHPYFEGLRALRVSAHFLIRRDGSLIQFVSCDQRAWHAGVSSFEGRPSCNDFSIGVELEGLDTEAFEAMQYDTLIELGRALQRHYPLRAVAGHSEIAPGRKTDPGPGFDWRRVLGENLLSLRRIETP